MSTADGESVWGRMVNPARPLLAVLQKTPVAIGVVLLCFAVAAASLWVQFRDQFAQDPRFALTVDKIEITPTPDWIKTDLKSEVFRDGSLAKLSLRDRNLVSEVADAFAVHSWIAEVKQVQKMHSQVRVELAYRKPVAMVRVVYNGEEDWLIPVDGEGTILPTADFSPNQAQDYLRIDVPGKRPRGFHGTRWDDDRVCAAAGIAASWSDRWRKLGLYQIVAVASSTGQRVLYELETEKRATVMWGSSIGEEMPGEPSPQRKIANLLKFVEEKGPLDELAPLGKLDLRSESVRRMPSTSVQVQTNFGS